MYKVGLGTYGIFVYEESFVGGSIFRLEISSILGLPSIFIYILLIMLFL